MAVTTPLLDDFVRADQGPQPSSSWTNGLATKIAGEGLIVLSNMATKTATGSAEQGAWWNPTSFGANQECWMRLGSTTGAAAGDEFRLYTGAISPGSYISGYWTQFAWGASAWDLALNRWDSGVSTFLTFTSTTFTVGDTAVMRRQGTLLIVEKVSAGVTTGLLSTTDSTYQNGGPVGLEFKGTQGLRADRFGGGSPAIVFPGTRSLRRIPHLIGR